MPIRRTLFVLSTVLLLAAPALGLQARLMAAAQPPAGSQGQVEGFVPVSELPAAEQLPAAPLLVAAYAFVWIAVMAYVWSIWKRLNRVEAEMRTLGQRQRKGSL